MKTIKFGVFSIILILILTVLIVFIDNLYNHRFNREIEAVASLKMTDSFKRKNDLYWFTLRNDKYNGFFTDEILFDVIAENDNLQFDYDKYTYVITCGYEMTNLKYSLSNMKNRKLLFIPKQFVGEVTLKEKYDGMVHIYRIKKMDIDCDYHNRQSYITWID